MKTTCLLRSGCGIRLSREGRQLAVAGDEQHPANGGAQASGASLLESLAFPIARRIRAGWGSASAGRRPWTPWRNAFCRHPGRVRAGRLSASICRASSPPRITTSPTS